MMMTRLERQAQLERLPRNRLEAMHNSYRRRGLVWTRHPVSSWRKAEIVSSLLALEGYER
jgi:hypothetical protein